MAIAKLPQCTGCPFSTLSDYITPDTMINDAEVLILAQAPGEHEEHGKRIEEYEWSYGTKQERLASVRPQPLIGPAGHWLQREFWPLTKLDYSKVSKANVLKCRPHNSNELPTIGSNKPVHGITVTMLKQAIQHCTRNYLRIPPSTKYIMAMGVISLYALTGELKTTYEDEETGKVKTSTEGITDWRGWCIGRSKTLLSTDSSLMGVTDYYYPNNYTDLLIFPIIHIAALFQSQRYYHATLHDFVRFGNLVRGTWPEALPEIRVNEIPQSIPSTIGFDTEYTESTHELEMWSMADVEGHIYVVDAEHSTRLVHLPESLNLITQNGLVDIGHFMPLVSHTELANITMEDCMLAHAVLWTGEPNSLDYILSKYGRYNRHKHLRTTQDTDTKYLYAGLDADTTLNHAWKGLLQDFKADPASWNEYKLRRQPLLNVIYRFQQRGVAIWQSRVEAIAVILDSEMRTIQHEAQRITGNPSFNIGSNAHVSRAIYERDFSLESAPSVPARTKSTRTAPTDTRQVSQKQSRKVVTQADVKSLINQLKLKLDIEE